MKINSVRRAKPLARAAITHPLLGNQINDTLCLARTRTIRVIPDDSIHGKPSPKKWLFTRGRPPGVPAHYFILLFRPLDCVVH